MNSLKISLFCIVFVFFITLPPSIHAYFTSSATLSNLFIGFGDWTPPTTTLTQLPQDIPTTERVINGTFEDGTHGWITTGTITTSSHRAILGNAQLFGTHSFSQTITGKGTVFITYTVMGNETPFLPVFSIMVNSTPMIQSMQIDNQVRTAVIPLTHEVNTITIVVESNPLLTTTPVWVEISEITTAKLAIGIQNTIRLTSDETYTTSWFELSHALPQQYVAPFSLSEHDEVGAFTFWSIDDFDNKEQLQRISYVQEKNIPEVGDVVGKTLEDAFHVITFSALSLTCPTSYFTQPAESPLPFSPIPYIDGKPRTFLPHNLHITNNTLSLVAKSCFQTLSQPKEILIP